MTTCYVVPRRTITWNTTFVKTSLNFQHDIVRNIREAPPSSARVVTTTRLSYANKIHTYELCPHTVYARTYIRMTLYARTRCTRFWIRSRRRKIQISLVEKNTVLMWGDVTRVSFENHLASIKISIKRETRERGAFENYLHVSPAIKIINISSAFLAFVKRWISVEQEEMTWNQFNTKLSWSQIPWINTPTATQYRWLVFFFVFMNEWYLYFLLFFVL